MRWIVPSRSMPHNDYVMDTYVPLGVLAEIPAMRTTGLTFLIVVAAQGASAQSEPVATRPWYVRPPMDSVSADSAVTDTQPARRGPGCYRAQSRSRCLGFLVTDFGFETPLYTTRHTPNTFFDGRDFELRVVWSLGGMRNFGRHAMGPVASITSEYSMNGLPWTLEWRYRNWLNSTQAVDAGLGYKTMSVWQNDGVERKGKGVTARLAWTPNRWIGVSAHMDLVRANDETHNALMLGAQSTLVSEFVLRRLPGAILRALLARIGVEVESDNDP